jgi:PPOX class probable F420-dependent enzyme
MPSAPAAAPEATVDLDRALAFVADHQRGVLATHKRDGRPQLSNIVYALGDDGIVRISVTDDRAKTANLRRDPRASLHVSRDDFWAYVVLEADVELSSVTVEPGDATGQELAGLYRAVAGEHDDWDDYFAAMVRDHRLVVRLAPTRAYGMLGGG